MKLAKEITLGGKTVQIPVTLADRVVNYFDPVKGAERYKSRAQMALSGGYSAADKTRRANHNGGKREMDADSAILPDLQTLREESQHILRNSPLAVGAIKTNVTKVVGTGLKAKSQIDRELLNLTDAQADAWELAAEREYKLATETREIDSERQLNFALLQALVFLKVLEDGECFVNLPRFARAGSPYKLKLQLVEAARVCNPGGQFDTERLIAGIEKDPTGAPLRYHIAKHHPGSIRSIRNRESRQWMTIEAFGKNTGLPLLLHLFDKTRPGQTRGVPYLAPVVEMLKQLGRYTDAEIMAAVVSGMVTAFVSSETGDPTIGEPNSTTDPYDTTGMNLQAGTVIGLEPNTKVDFLNPGRPNTAFDPFVMAVLRQIGTALELPFEILIKHFTSSYSAARAALLEAWAYFRRRRTWLVSSLCQPIYEQIITEAVATGRLTAPGFFTDPLIKKAWLGTLWIGDAPGQIDPLKEANAANMRLNTLKITTHDEECAAYDGSDWEQKWPRILANHQALVDSGMYAPATPADPAAAVDDTEDTP